MELNQQGIESAGAENQPAEVATAETKTAPQEQSQRQSVAATTPEVAQPEKQTPSPRLQQRISKLTDARNRAAEEAAQAKAQLEQVSLGQLPPWMTQESSPSTWDDLAGQDIDPNELRRRVAQEAEAIAEAKLVEFQTKQQQQQAAKEAQEKSRAQIEAMEADFRLVETTYGKMNPDSEEYDEAYTTKVATLFEKAALSNPDLKLSEFVETIEDLAGRSTQSALANTAEVLRTQAGEAALVGGEVPTETTNEDEGSRLYRQAQETGEWAQVLKHRIFGNK